MLATEILTILQEAGATARINGTKLLVEPRSLIPAELVPEIRQSKSEIMELIAQTVLAGQLTPDGEQILSRLKAGSQWLMEAHLSWVSEEPNSPADEKFSIALAAWDLLERKLRTECRYEGCVYGPGQRCPTDAPVMCDACV